MHNTAPDGNGWSEYKQLFLASREDMKRLEGKVDDLTTAVAKLEVKAALAGSMWGAVTGATLAFIGHAISTMIGKRP